MIRIYGPVAGEDSFTQVTRGMARACELSGHLAGVMPIDRAPHDDEPVPGGADARVALHLGSPNAIFLGHTEGQHALHYLLLAPNSHGIPHRVRVALDQKISTFRGNDEASKERPMLDGFVAPSQWAAGVLRHEFPSHRIIVAPHGIDPDIFSPDLEVHRGRVERMKQGTFSVLHFSSTLGQRKGTRELLTAWRIAKVARSLPPGAALALVVNPLAVLDHQWMVRDARVDDQNVLVVPNPHSPPATLAGALRWSHCLVQPSRAEGFGLLPLEARACGTPVIATLCTGHSEHMSGVTPGVVTVPHGDPAPLDDYEGSVAPSVSPDAIALALVEAYETWAERSAVAMAAANAVRAKWAWENICRAAIRELDPD